MSRRITALLVVLAGCEAQDAPHAQGEPPAVRAEPRATAPGERCADSVDQEESERDVKHLRSECTRSFVSPDGQWELFTLAESQAGIPLRLRRRGSGVEAVPIAVADLPFPASLSWSPDSSGFIVNDSEGSGQSNHLRYFAIRDGTVTETRALHRAATALYRRLFECAEAGNYLYVEGEGWWLGERLLSIRVWSSHHSAGCPLDPIAGNELHLIGDPATARIFRDHRRLRASAGR